MPNRIMFFQVSRTTRRGGGVADVVKTKFKVEAGDGPHPENRWYAWLNEGWVRIPPEKVVKEHAPDGQPYLFMWSDSIQCFVPPKGGL